jgi:hypothetical protein
MKKYINYLKDVIGNNYLGIKFTTEEVKLFLDKLKDEMGDEYDTLTTNQQNRDKGYHMSLLPVAEYNKISKDVGMSNFVNSLDKIFNYEVDDLELKGIGTGFDKKRGNNTYFIVCSSDKLDALRARYNLSRKDLHITIGFNKKDVFGVDKSIVKWKI